MSTWSWMRPSVPIICGWCVHYMRHFVCPTTWHSDLNWRTSMEACLDIHMVHPHLYYFAFLSGENITWAQRFPLLTQKRKQEYGWCNDHLDIADWGCRAANCKKCHSRFRGSNQKANNCLLPPEKKDMDPEQRSVLEIIDIILNTVVLIQTISLTTPITHLRCKLQSMQQGDRRRISLWTFKESLIID